MEENYSVIEWTIENFSCWNFKIHGNKISLPKIDLSSKAEKKKFLKLFPRGISGVEEYLVVKIYYPWNSSGECELSYIGSDGTLIKTESMLVKRDCSEIFVGPVYENIVTRIRENEPFHKDILTLRVRMKFRLVTFNRHARTVIDVFNTSLKFNTKVFESRGINIGIWDCISIIQYSFDGNTEEDLFLYAKMVSCKDVKLQTQFCSQNILAEQKTRSDEELKIKLMLRSFAGNAEKTLVQISFSHYCKNDISKMEVLQHVFTGMDEWILPIYIIVKEQTKNTFRMLVSMKIIPGNIPKTYSHWSRYPEVSEIFLTNTETVPGESSSQHFANSTDVLTKDLMHLYQEQTFSDLKIRCGQFTFGVHRGILSARSPVLKKLFSIDMKVAMFGSLDIEDLDPSTLAGFLSFLYSGTVEDLQWDNALKLYYAAEKYQVPSLKRECASVLSAGISVSNVCEILSFADKYSDDQLTSAVQEFILKNYNRVLKSNEWIHFMTVDPNLLLKTVTLFAQKDLVGKMNGS